MLQRLFTLLFVAAAGLTLWGQPVQASLVEPVPAGWTDPVEDSILPTGWTDPVEDGVTPAGWTDPVED